MKNKHVSNYDIQQYAFDVSACENEVIAHISSCNLCKQEVAYYNALSDAIKNLPEPTIDYNLSEKILKQIETNSKKKSISYTIIYFLIVLALGGIISCQFYYKEVFIDLFRSNSTISTFFMISVAVSISLVIALDMLRSYTKKIDMLNYE